MRLEAFDHVEIHGQQHSFKPVTRIPDKAMLGAIACKGVLDTFNLEDLHLPDGGLKYRDVLDSTTGAVLWKAEIPVFDKSGQVFSAVFTRDLDNRGISLVRESPQEGNLVVVKLNLRDRNHDGTEESTPPGFRRRESFPARTGLIGGTNWTYDDPHVDLQLSGRASVEISRVSSDPNPVRVIFDRLNHKGERLYPRVTPYELARFIDDPFAALPFKDPSPENLTTWYRNWWQVVNRGLRGKWIAYPGQVSERGFSGFSSHVLDQLPSLLKSKEYTHISSVPTWIYVWKMNLQNSGFTADHPAHHQEVLDFLKKLGNVELPVLNNGHIKDHRRVSDLPEKDSLISWLAVMPFALKINQSLNPDLGIQPEHQQAFDDLYNSLRENLVISSGVTTYPLAPGRNLWQSLSIQE